MKRLNYRLKVVKRFSEQQQVTNDGVGNGTWREVWRLFSWRVDEVENQFEETRDGDEDQEPSFHVEENEKDDNMVNRVVNSCINKKANVRGIDRIDFRA